VKVVVTGTEGRLAERLRRAGVDVMEWPLVAVEPIQGPPLQADAYDWVVLTSRHGVEELFRRLEGTLPRVAVIGPGTAEALREHGVEPALVPVRSTQEGLLAEFPESAGKVLFAGAEGARELLAESLDADVVPLYRTIELQPETQPDADAVVLASASAARAYAKTGCGLPSISIGPVTTAEAEHLGIGVLAEAETHDLEGLVEAVKLAASRAGSSPS
jgi:uroporphyrinogen III methyltransferase / synthase